MTENEAINRLIDHFRIHDDGRPTPYLDDAVSIAINALEKQIPKKVKIQQWIYTKCDCGYEFSKDHGDGYYSIPLEKKTNYCPKCGQKLDWSDTN